MPLVKIVPMVKCPMERLWIVTDDCTKYCDHFNGVNEWQHVVCGYVEGE